MRVPCSCSRTRRSAPRLRARGVRRLDRLVRRVALVELHYFDVADAIELLEAFARGVADDAR